MSNVCKAFISSLCSFYVIINWALDRSRSVETIRNCTHAAMVSSLTKSADRVKLLAPLAISKGSLLT